MQLLQNTGTLKQSVQVQTNSISLIVSSSDGLSVNSRNNAKLITQTRAVSQGLVNLADHIHYDVSSKSF